jgi:hypothetical protein
MKLLKEHYPLLQAALVAMTLDQGLEASAAPEIDCDDRCWEGESHGPADLNRAEHGLSLLSPDERETLAVGCEDDWGPLYEKCGEENRYDLHVVLDVLFCINME